MNIISTIKEFKCSFSLKTPCPFEKRKKNNQKNLCQIWLISFEGDITSSLWSAGPTVAIRKKV